jgi:endonuclease/exonuclease/phosphatase family metal-dependent hydrolase
VFPYAFWTHTGETGLGNGLVILSKHPLFRGRELRFVAQDPNAFVDRMVIAANVLTADSYFTVLCTHLQAGLTGEPLTVKMEEIQETLAWAQAEGYLEAGWPAFWLGDFNAGPDPLMTCDPSSECPEPPDLANYDLVRQTFTDPNEGFPECTSCRDQFIPMAVIAIFNNEPDQRIDHCFHRGLETGVFVSGDRVFDEPQSIMIAGGETLEWLSDHYGMSCAFAGSP